MIIIDLWEHNKKQQDKQLFCSFDTVWVFQSVFNTCSTQAGHRTWLQLMLLKSDSIGNEWYT